MKIRYIPCFREWLNETIVLYPEYNRAEYFNRLYYLYTRKFK